MFRFPVFYSFLGLALWLAGLTSCGPAPEPGLPELDLQQSRAIADAAANDLIGDNPRDLLSRLDAGFHSMVSNQKEMEVVIQRMYGIYGKPLECDYKTSKSGTRVDGTWKRSKRDLFYAVKTTKYPIGKYFLKIEVVPNAQASLIDVAGFGFFEFKDNDIPDYLR
ncbi:MAG TPA: hypothetical protein VK859_17350 [bacterium]|nr:hypothetical protein [bacterium]